MASSCINSNIVKKVTVEGGKVPEEHGFDWFKEKWVGNCGPLKSESMDNLELVQKWFSTRGLRTKAVEVSLREDKNTVVSPEFVSLPLEKSSDLNLLARLLTKSLLLQNKVGVEGVAGEISTDLILADVFGTEFVSKEWKSEGTGLFGEFSNVSRDCEKNFVPEDQKTRACSTENLKIKDGISNWALRWIAVRVFDDVRNDHTLGTSVEISKKLFGVIKGISEDKTINLPITSLDELEVRTKNIFSRVDASMECYNKWAQDFEKINVLIAGSAQDIRLATPLPKNTLILSFESGFQLINGDHLDLPEGDVFRRTHRVAFVGCESPTVADILEYSGSDLRLLFIETCESQKLRLDLFDRYGSAGVQHLNPNVRFLQFHKPSIKLAMDWGLKSTSTFEFTRTESATPEKLRRLFGWNNSDSMSLISAAIPIVEIFNSQKGEVPSLKGWIQSDQNEVRDTSQLDPQEDAEQTRKIF
jgi:hypothetical protein